jgi:hypothetical protein
MSNVGAMVPIPNVLVLFSIRGFFAFLGGLFAEANGAGATFLLGAYCISKSRLMRIGIPFW